MFSSIKQTYFDINGKLGSPFFQVMKLSFLPLMNIHLTSSLFLKKNSFDYFTWDFVPYFVVKGSACIVH